MAAELNKLTDEKLMELIQKHHHAAFATLVRRHTHRFYAVAYRSLFNQSEAEDIVQDAFLKIWNKPTIWKAGRGAKFTTWFYRVVVNGCFDYDKKKKPYLLDEAHEIPEDSALMAETVERESRYGMMEDAIRRLPERQRIALNLCFYEGLSNKEAAAIMNVNLKALQSLIMRAKTTLRETISSDIGDVA